MRVSTDLSSALKFSGACIVAALVGAGSVMADPNDNKLIVDGKELTTKVKGAKDGPFEDVYSGWRFRTPQTQKFQTDDFENPGFPLVDLGAELWEKVDGSAGKACASCHPGCIAVDERRPRRHAEVAQGSRQTPGAAAACQLLP